MIRHLYTQKSKAFHSVFIQSLFCRFMEIIFLGVFGWDHQVIGNDTDAASVVYAVSAFVDSKHIQ